MPRVRESKDKTLQVRMSESLYEWIEKEAAAEAMNKGEFVRFVLLNLKRAGR
jgi:predicted DNA binding CopG/RHH family protein